MSWQDTSAKPWPIFYDSTITGEGAGYLQKLERLRGAAGSVDVLAYFHSDLTIHAKGWDDVVLAQFDDPRVAVVSFCGAMRHGHEDIYRVSYELVQLARYDFISNMTDAEAHGARVLEPRDVAVIDSFSCIIRKTWLDEIGGWFASGLHASHCSDYWICLMAHRHRMKVRYVPIACTHRSGGVRGAGTFDYAGWCKTTPLGSDQAMHRENHAILYDQFRDVLPVRMR